MIGMDEQVKVTNKLNAMKKYLLSVRNEMVIAKGDSGATNHYLTVS